MQKYQNYILILFFSGFLSSCEVVSQKRQNHIYLGADLSYVNELVACGAKFTHNGKAIEPYDFFASKGANLTRLRLWHKPTWTSYSTLADVKKSIAKSKAKNMPVLLDFHYSDTWADPAHQLIPSAWSGITDTEILGDSLYLYTKATLTELNNENLLPDFVQIGNETNSEILMEKETKENGPTNWPRNISLFNKGLKAVSDFNKTNNSNVQTMLHVAQPDEALEWFENANNNNLQSFDWIGLSYYPNWSKFDLKQLEETISTLKSTYNKHVMVVETGYPYSTRNFDEASNVLGNVSGLKGYPISPEGQLSFMIDLTASVIKAGGEGVIYWEPAWVNSNCKTQWGTGSHWENAAFFDASRNNEALPVFQFFGHNYFK
ncbi:glycoside hydrolase family 53 protein [Arcticibacterium luteifluviistationis]|uniref:Arabinogalactan endo-beta-1,4-galactanase n=1 Tax=Arcticibacterium luteifluviistationis TaxID=1784714 RepID=A0A2Z4GGD9_9BACT|nr:glycosyl hydrolase 53 family protein [Arcticibacterium luteifluviistationis]AWW00473.1 arabinogalactan endo-1,4-beta-galactosidase [Arcticibacterium luteifluviistationis]